MNLHTNAIFKIITRDSNGNTPYCNNNSIDYGIHYIFRLEKANYQFYYGIWQPSPENATTQLEDTRTHNPDNTIEQKLQHFIISFKTCKNTLFINHFAHSVAMLLSQHYQVCFALHDDKPNLHVHFMASTTSYITNYPPLTYEKLTTEYLPQIFAIAQQNQIRLEVFPDV